MVPRPTIVTNMAF